MLLSIDTADWSPPDPSPGHRYTTYSYRTISQAFLSRTITSIYQSVPVAKSVNGFHVSSGFNLYAPPISVRAYASPFIPGLNTMPGTKPPPPPIRTLFQL